jgi:polysaccharide export outer membrane protein
VIGIRRNRILVVRAVKVIHDLEVIMRPSVEIHEVILTVLVLAFFTLAGNREARSQTAPPAHSQTQPDPATLAKSLDTSAPVVPADKNPSVPVVGIGDLLKVSVLGAPDSDQEVRVGADGTVVLNFIGAVPIAGQTTAEAQAAIAKKLIAGGFFTEPQVSVFTKEYVTQGVSVMGEVQKPGVYPVLGARKLFDVLSLAGGTTPKAGKVISITHRDTPQAPASVSLSNDASESVQSNVDIYPGDTIVVSKAGLVYVVGDVHRPSGVPMDNTTMTVLQAIAMAEGTNTTAALNKAKLIRRSSGVPQEIPLPLKDMLASKVPDVRLQAEDIVFVPTSNAKKAGVRTLEAIIQTATGVAMYGVRP